MKVKSIYNFIIVCSLFFVAIVSINSDTLNSVALYVVIPFSFLLSYCKNRRLIVNRYLYLLLLLYAWDMFSALWSQYPSSAERELHTILGAFMLSFIFASNASNIKVLKYLYITFILLYIGAWYYSYNNLNEMIGLHGEQTRLNDAKLNANTMSYYTFYTTFSIYILFDLVKSQRWKKLCKLGFILMIPISFFVAIITASRQVLIIQIPLMALLIFERYYISANKKVKIYFIFLTIIAVALMLPTAIAVYNDSYLAMRSEQNIKEDSRWLLIIDAINVGLDHFPIGVGAGSYINYSYSQRFSHCSYSELFANNGVVGLFLYCYLLYYFVKVQWKRYLFTRDKNFFVFLIFGLIYIFDQIFYVFYLDIWLISFFLLVATHSEVYYLWLKNNSK